MSMPLLPGLTPKHYASLAQRKGFWPPFCHLAKNCLELLAIQPLPLACPLSKPAYTSLPGLQLGLKLDVPGSEDSHTCKALMDCISKEDENWGHGSMTWFSVVEMFPSPGASRLMQIPRSWYFHSIQGLLLYHRGHDRAPQLKMFPGPFQQ